MSGYFILKCAISGVIVGIVSELGQRSPGLAAVIASLPLTSILAMIWLYRETQDLKAIYDLSNGIAMVVLPSLVFFIGVSLLIKMNWGFCSSLGISSITMVGVYFIYLRILGWLGYSS